QQHEQTMRRRNFAIAAQYWCIACQNLADLMPMLDHFDLALLNHVQRDDSQTADELARAVPLSPSAIARRLRRLRGEGWIARTIGILSSRLTENRLRALVFIQLNEHADIAGKAALEHRLLNSGEVQFCYEIAGTFDLVALFDCSGMAKFNRQAEELLTTDATVRRYETSFVKREVKFAPFVEMGATS
ncbi:MAG: Lrp/AsnC family transcriptional regulator, partial [Terriglobales bacterium]